MLAIEYKKTPEVQDECSPSPALPEPEKVEKVKELIVEPPDLLVYSVSFCSCYLLYCYMRTRQFMLNFLVSLCALPFVARV